MIHYTQLKSIESFLLSSLGVITKGTVIEVNISELGMVTAGGKVVWGKYAQVSVKADLFLNKKTTVRCITMP